MAIAAWRLPSLAAQNRRTDRRGPHARPRNLRRNLRYSAWGPNADRRGKSLKLLGMVGSKFGAYSHRVHRTPNNRPPRSSHSRRLPLRRPPTPVSKTLRLRPRRPAANNRPQRSVHNWRLPCRRAPRPRPPSAIGWPLRRSILRGRTGSSGLNSGPSMSRRLSRRAGPPPPRNRIARDFNLNSAVSS